MADDQDSRTEDPTAKRQAEAAKKGNIGLSRDVSFAATLLMTLAAVSFVLPRSLHPLLALLQSLVEHPEAYPLNNRGDLAAIFYRIAAALALAIGPVMAMFAVAGVVAVFGQQGRFLWAYERLGFQWDMLSPARGFSRVFSGRALVEWAKGLAKMVAIAVPTALVLRPELFKINGMVGIEPAQILAQLDGAAKRLLLTVTLAIAAIAAADVFYQRWSTQRSLRMTKQEVRDEHKTQEGDPTIKAKHRARRQARARRRMMQAVPKAAVVITNPTHYAVALSYQQGMNAPKVVAKGADFVAQRIRALAEEAGVPIIENPPVARALYAAVEVDDEIPPEQYKAVAEIIGYVMRLSRPRRAV